MSVTTVGPVNPAQLLAQLGNPVATLTVSGDPTKAGAVLSSEHLTDAQISQALGAVSGNAYDANFPHGPQAAAIAAIKAAAAGTSTMTPAQLAAQLVTALGL